jgi:hypothetical protein
MGFVTCVVQKNVVLYAHAVVACARTGTRGDPRCEGMAIEVRQNIVCITKHVPRNADHA